MEPPRVATMNRLRRIREIVGTLVKEIQDVDDDGIINIAALDPRLQALHNELGELTSLPIGSLPQDGCEVSPESIAQDIRICEEAVAYGQSLLDAGHDGEIDAVPLLAYMLTLPAVSLPFYRSLPPKTQDNKKAQNAKVDVLKLDKKTIEQGDEDMRKKLKEAQSRYNRQANTDINSPKSAPSPSK